jgi:hypothetical protein
MLVGVPSDHLFLVCWDDRTRLALVTGTGCTRPAPTLDLGHVFAVPVYVIAMIDQLVAEMLFDVRGFGAKARHPLDNVHRQMEAIESVEHHHVERGRCGTLLVVASHMHVGVVSAAVGQTSRA